MSEMKYKIMESWPMIKEDLMSFLSDTDAWLIAELKDARKAKDWEKINNVIDIMESVHTLSHSH
jgi:flagellin-specific chaperone FliS